MFDLPCAECGAQSRLFAVEGTTYAYWECDAGHRKWQSGPNCVREAFPIDQANTVDDPRLLSQTGKVVFDLLVAGGVGRELSKRNLVTLCNTIGFDVAYLVLVGREAEASRG